MLITAVLYLLFSPRPSSLSSSLCIYSSILSYHLYFPHLNFIHFPHHFLPFTIHFLPLLSFSSYYLSNYLPPSHLFLSLFISSHFPTISVLRISNRFNSSDDSFRSTHRRGTHKRIRYHNDGLYDRRA